MIAFRISRVKDLSMDRIFADFKSNYPYVLLSSEGGETTDIKGKTFHIHGVVCSPTAETITVREQLKALYPNAKGNRCLYTKESHNKKQLIKYTLKEGNFIYQGFLTEFISRMEICSNTKDDIKSKILELEENYLCREINFEDFAVAYVEVLINHNQNPRLSTLTPYFNKMQLKSGKLSTRSFLVNNNILDY